MASFSTRLVRRGLNVIAAPGQLHRYAVSLILLDYDCRSHSCGFHGSAAFCMVRVILRQTRPIGVGAHLATRLILDCIDRAHGLTNWTSPLLGNTKERTSERHTSICSNWFGAGGRSSLNLLVQ